MEKRRGRPGVAASADAVDAPVTTPELQERASHEYVGQKAIEQRAAAALRGHRRVPVAVLAFREQVAAAREKAP